MEFEPATAWAWLLAAASAIVLVGNAIEKIAKAVEAAKRPDAKQDEDIKQLQDEVANIKRKLEADKTRLDRYGEGERVTQLALLALLDHNLDGNNVDQMRDAKDALQKHLLNK